MIKTKECTICKEYKELKHFGFKGKNSNILKSSCKQCYALKNNCNKSPTIIPNLPNEEWKDIKGYENIYQASSLGRIKSLDRFVSREDLKNGWVKGRILKQPYNANGYKMVTLNKNNKGKRLIAHRVIAETFIPNPENKSQVNHINGIKDDNRVENLEWNTPKENIKHSIKTGLRKPRLGVKNNSAKLNEESVLAIREKYKNGESILSLSKEYGVVKTTIECLIKRKTWVHI